MAHIRSSVQKCFRGRIRWLFEAKSPVAAIAQSLVSRFGILVINLGTSVIVARGLGPSGRGAAAAMALWPIIFCGLTTLGVPTALRYQLRRNTDNADDLFSVAIILGILTGFIAMLGGVVVIPHWLRQYPESVVHFSLLMMLFAPEIMCNNILQAYLEARGQFVASNRMLYVPPAVTLLVLLALRQTQTLSPFTVPLAFFVPTAFVTAWTGFSQRRAARFPAKIAALSRKLLHYGVRAYGLNILTTLSGQIDQAIIVGYLSPGSFGLYAVALNLSAVLGLFSLSLNTVLFPQASGLDARAAVALVSRSARIIAAISVCGYAIAILFMPLVIKTVYGYAYADDIALTRVLMLEVALGAVTTTLSQAFMATARPLVVTMIQGAGVGITFPLLLIFIPRYGLLGAAFALLSSTALRLILVMLSFPVYLKMRVPSLLVNKGDFRSLRSRIEKTISV